MNAKQIERALNRSYKGGYNYSIQADFYLPEHWMSQGHLLMGRRNISYRRIKAAAIAVLQTGKFSRVQFRNSGSIIEPRVTEQHIQGLKNMCQRELELNPHYPKHVAFYVKMNRLSERLNAQYVS